MARLARVVAAGFPHHVTQRGNRRQQVFFSEDDYRIYLELMGEGCRAARVQVWGYCLMPNHVHLILTPADEGGLRAALSEAHRRYSRRVNFREVWRGYLWQGRFASVPMDDGHLMAAARYVELNPVRSRLAAMAQDWPWSSVHAHLAGVDDGLVTTAPCWIGLATGAPSWPGAWSRPNWAPSARVNARAGRWARRSSSPDWSRAWGEHSRDRSRGGNRSAKAGRRGR